MLISGGGRRELASLYNNIGGSRKATSYKYANISGTRKQIFPKLTVYVWNRYYVETTYETYYTTSETSFSGKIYFDSSDNVNTWNFDSSSGMVWAGSYYIGSTSACIEESGYWTIDSSSYRTGDTTSSCYYGYGGDYGKGYTTAQYDVTVSTSSYSNESCGSYIDKVTSTSRYTYPDNSNSGSYWYIYQGTSTSQ